MQVNPQVYIMASTIITRVEATESQINEAKAAQFAAGGFGFNDGEILIIESYSFISHKVNGDLSKNAVPVIKLKGREDLIYLRSLIRERFDNKNEPVKFSGTLNLFVKEISGGTVGEVMAKLEEKLPAGSKITALRKHYIGINKLGDFQTISYNEFNF